MKLPSTNGGLRMRRLGLLLVALVPVLAAATWASTAAADPLNPCGQALSRPFLPWLDPANYAQVPGGSFENGATGWTLAGGARLAAGNETYYVHGSADKTSLLLPAGGSATSSNVCLGLLSPTTRFFVRNVGSPLGLLRVDLVYRSLLGLQLKVPLALLPAGSGWQPTIPILVLANLTVPPLVTNGTVQVAFGFVPVGIGAAFQIDDDYVDPYQGR
jgi:hypothetical protein